MHPEVDPRKHQSKSDVTMRIGSPTNLRPEIDALRVGVPGSGWRSLALQFPAETRVFIHFMSKNIQILKQVLKNFLAAAPRSRAAAAASAASIEFVSITND